MTKSDQNKLRLLVGLLVVLSVTIYFGYRMNKPANPAVVQAQDQKSVPVVAAPSDAKLRLDLLEKSGPDGGLGKRNLFSYPPVRPPEPPPVRPQPVIPPPPPITQTPVQTPVRQLPPTMAFKYLGFAFVEPNSKALIATMTDGSLNKNFFAVEGDVWMGRYRIVRITDRMVEVEDLESNRRQTFPLTKDQ